MLTRRDFSSELPGTDSPEDRHGLHSRSVDQYFDFLDDLGLDADFVCLLTVSRRVLEPPRVVLSCLTFLAADDVPPQILGSFELIDNHIFVAAAARWSLLKRQKVARERDGMDVDEQ